MTTIDTRPLPSLPTIVEYWTESAPEIFPNIAGARGSWDDPFCFRCGWWPPSPEDFKGDRWSIVNGWLERAHLLDKSAGGPNEPSNLVPLCPLCHLVMPEYRKSAEPAIAWVRAGQPYACPGLYQLATFRKWPDTRRHQFPGRLALHRLFNAAALELASYRRAGVAA